MTPTYDCIIVGAGPAGLTAAIYLARFRLSVMVIDSGQSRAAQIPLTRNHAGYPGGIAGTDLLARMRQQARQFGPLLVEAEVSRIMRHGADFVVFAGVDSFSARTVLLATGVINNRPAIAPDVHDVALSRGLLRYCPVCDGYEVTDKRVGIIGTETHGHDEAVFLRMFTRDVTLLSPDGPHTLCDADRKHLNGIGVTVIDGPCTDLFIDGDSIAVPTPQGVRLFDSVYPALGSVIRSELAVALGVGVSDEGSLTVDRHQRTTVAGLYAAGDMVLGLDQISHAMGEAGVAATTIRNDLSIRMPLLR